MARPELPQLPKPTLLDRAIGYLSPAAGLRRLQAKALMALAGGYTGARVDKAQLAGWRTRAGSPDSDIIPDLDRLRQRSRDLSRNAPVATGAINTSVHHVIGTGLSCRPKVNAQLLGLTEEQAAAWNADTMQRFCAWFESTDCDIARQLTGYGMQQVGFRAVLESGDVGVLTPIVSRPGRQPMLSLQLIEADRISNPNNTADTDGLVEGIEFNPATGETLAVHVADRHPGDLNRKAAKWTRVQIRGGRTGRRNFLHLYRPTRPGQRRGVPMLAPVIEPLKQLDRYTEAELNAAVISGMFAVFLRMDPEAFQDLFDDGAKTQYMDHAQKWSGTMESGKAVNLLPGEEPVSFSPSRPNAQFDPFVSAVMTQVGMSLGIPREVLTATFQSSYSAAKGALLQAWRLFNGWRDWMATSFCQPVYETWLEQEIAAGRISAPGFFASDLTRWAWSRAQWVGDGPGSIEPTKEVAAAKERIALGISTREAESILHDGVDWETKHQQQVRETQLRRQAGFANPEDAPPAPAPVAAPEPGEDDDAEERRRQGQEESQRQTQALLAAISQAMSTVSAAVAALASRESPAPVTVNVEPAQAPVVPVTVNAGDTKVEMPAQTIVVQSPSRGATRQVITERDEDGEARVIETHPLN
jgi:lambda family phage portal protein